jgi:two-component system LytT family sensor kinase
MTRATVGSSVRLYALCMLAWTVVGLFFFSQDLARIVLWQQRTPVWDQFAARMAASYISALLTPTVLQLSRHWRIERRNWPRTVALHSALSVLFALVELALETFVYLQAAILPDLLNGPFPKAYTQMLAVGFHANLVVYWLLIGAETGFTYYARFREHEKTTFTLRIDAAELKAELGAARLSALKMQLQPHFLFNTLNAIVVLIRQNRTVDAEEMLTRLSDLLRAVLDDAETQEVPLRRELDCVRLYLAIEKVRFGSRLHTEVSASADTLDAAVPHMGLQPLVENAVRHGVGRRSAPGAIHLSARKVESVLQIRIADNGPGPGSPRAPNETGIGLANTRARLKQLYGDTATLRIEDGDPCGAVVTIEIPYRCLPPGSDHQRIELNGL